MPFPKFCQQRVLSLHVFHLCCFFLNICGKFCQYSKNQYFFFFWVQHGKNLGGIYHASPTLHSWAVVGHGIEQNRGACPPPPATRPDAKFGDWGSTFFQGWKSLILAVVPNLEPLRLSNSSFWFGNPFIGNKILFYHVEIPNLGWNLPNFQCLWFLVWWPKIRLKLHTDNSLPWWSSLEGGAEISIVLSLQKRYDFGNNPRGLFGIRPNCEMRETQPPQGGSPPPPLQLAVDPRTPSHGLQTTHWKWMKVK